MLRGAVFSMLFESSPSAESHCTQSRRYFQPETETCLSLGRRAWQIHQQIRRASPFKSRLSARILSSSYAPTLAPPNRPVPSHHSLDQRGADRARGWPHSPLLGTVWRLCGGRDFGDTFLHGAPPLHLSMILL